MDLYFAVDSFVQATEAIDKSLDGLEALFFCGGNNHPPQKGKRRKTPIADDGAPARKCRRGSTCHFSRRTQYTVYDDRFTTAGSPFWRKEFASGT